MTTEMEQLKGVFALLNEGDIADYLGENPEYFEPLFEARSVVLSYFPKAPVSLQMNLKNEHDSRPFIVSIHPPHTDLFEGFRRLDCLYREWGDDPLELMIVIGFNPYTIEEEKERIRVSTRA